MILIYHNKFFLVTIRFDVIAASKRHTISVKSQMRGATNNILWMTWKECLYDSMGTIIIFVYSSSIVT